MIPQAYFAGEDIRLDDVSFLSCFLAFLLAFFLLGLDLDRIDTIY
jgi:hypothetical protein